MATPFTLSLSPNYKPCYAAHREWGLGAFGNGESWPRCFGNNLASSSDIYRLGIIPTFVLTAPTVSVGTSSAGTYGICIVYRTTYFSDGLSGDDIQGNRSNIVDITLGAGDGVLLTKVVTTDTKVTLIDIYAAQKIGAIYGAFYRVVKGAANSAGTVDFNIIMANGTPTSTTTTSGTAQADAFILSTDNDFPTAQPIMLEINGRLLTGGGIVKRVTATFTNASSTVTTVETVYDGIEFWNIKRDSDTTGGFNGRGSYLCRYATANSVTLVNPDGTADTYDGTSGSETTNIWTEPNRKFSKLLNPHSFPIENINNDYPSAMLAAGKVPNTNRVLIMGSNWVIAEDYDRLPLDEGLNFVSTEYGCGSHFSIVAAHGRLYWLDFCKGKREIVMSDGSNVVPISTQKIKSILNRITLDSNSEAWRLQFIHGAYYRNEDTIRWGIYLDSNTVANFILELDLNSGDLRIDPEFYPLRYLDVFTYGNIRGRVYIGQFGYTGGIARLGLDNIDNRYYDWVASGTMSGSLSTASNTLTVMTIASGTLDTAGDKLQGIQVLIWRENTDGTEATLIVNPTFYQCRISTNDATTFTVNYVETMDVVGMVSVVDTQLPSIPSGSGWRFAIGVIQGIAGPKWFTSGDSRTEMTFRELSVNHGKQNVSASSSPIRFQGFENFDNVPRDAQYLDAIVEAEQVADTTLCGSSRALPKTNPAPVLGFSLIDNNVNTLTYALNIETITLSVNDASIEDNIVK